MFTFEEHQELGEKLKAISNDIMDLSIKIPNKYNRNKLARKATKAAIKAHITISDLRSVLDDMVCAENPNRKDTDVVNVYYGEKDLRVTQPPLTA